MGRDHVEGGRIIEHYRADVWRPLLSYLGAASLIVALGSISMAGALFHSRAQPLARASAVISRGSPVDAAGVPIENEELGYELGLGLFGLVCVAGGGLLAIFGLSRLMSEEHYLALRTDGAYYRRGTERSLMRWEDVEAVRRDGEVVVLVTHDGESWARAERYAGIDAPGLATRVAEVRRKALFGLL